MAIASTLPHVNAALNAVAVCFLLAGFLFIKSGNRNAHRVAMALAAIVSGVFLISYVTLRIYAPIFQFAGEGAIRPVYYALLISHVILAITIVPLVALTLVRALSGRFEKHRKVARITWPIWMYVSVSGILVYLMLYQFYPPGHAGGGS
jgi:uncharacterized membrane protein YozB (DUF420 family)